MYSKYFWLDQEGNVVNGDGVVVHELAHQWFGDDVALARWQDIWLNEGFATYAEWLWAEHEGQGHAAGDLPAPPMRSIPADDPFWATVIGDPGIDLLFDNAVYVRGAMTLQALREEVGDDAFFEIVKQLGVEQERRQRDDAAVHRARRARSRACSSTSSSTPGCSPANARCSRIRPQPTRGLRARARTRPAGSIRCRRGWRAAATEPSRGRGREPGALGGAPRERPRYARSL